MMRYDYSGPSGASSLFPASISLMLAFTLAGSANAQLVEEDLFASGDGLVTLDTATGLRWLDVTETTGLSYDDVEAGAGGWTALGFRHATGEEVCQLFSTYALAPTPCPQGTSDPEITIPGGDVTSTLLAFIGITHNDPPVFVGTHGLYDDGTGGASVGRAVVWYEPDQNHSRANVNDDRVPTTEADYAGNLTGHFLVSSPETYGCDEAGTTTLVIRGDTSWRAIAPLGNQEGTPIATVGEPWEGSNPGWNTDISYDDSAAAGWTNVAHVIPGCSPLTAECVWIDSAGSTPSYYRKVFEIPGAVQSGTLEFAVDDDAQVYINGSLVIDDQTGHADGIQSFDVTAYLEAGENLVAIKAHDSFGGGEAFIFELTVDASEVIDFEGAAGNDNDDFVATNGMFAGLNWSQNGDLAGKTRWEIDTDNVPFASLPGCADDGTVWIQGFAEGVSTPGGGPGDPNRAKFGWDGANPLTFHSMWLRTRFISDHPNSPDANADGIDDRWLTSVDVRFRDVDNNQSTVTVDLTDPVDPSGWVELTAEDVSGNADLEQLKAVFFLGDSGTTVPGVRNDRFAIDNLDVTF